MTANTTRRIRAALTTLAVAVGPSACTDYILETTVHVDGSGVREERVEVGENEDVSITPERYLALMHLGPDEGWSRNRGVNANGDSVDLFLRRLAVPDLASWSDVSGSFRIDAADAARGAERMGYVRLGEVRFRNAVQVGRGRTSDGTTILTYRETFTWDQAVDALVEYLVSRFDASVSRRYPRLSPEERGQIVGSFRARVWMAVADGLLSDDSDEDAILEAVAADVALPGGKIVATRYPGEGSASVAELVGAVFEDQELEGIARLLPGLDLGFNAHVVFRLNLPGEVTDTNAHRVEGTTLVWEFGPSDALEGPIELRAQSVVAG
ncbi:MAG TPA: hypothetical protein VLA43_04420 [Longimicrobiales bacterium]|nr:hypothetical protein [Longimicrobiales bacterium]